MGNGGAKQTNRLLQEQTNRANALESTLGERSNAAYGNQEALRNELLGNYRGLYSGSMSGEGAGAGGGGGSPAFGGIDWSSTSLPFYTEAMNTGLWSPERIGQAESYAAGPIKGIYEGVMRNVLSAQRGSGTPGVGSGLQRLIRNQAYEGGQNALGAKLGINREIDENRFRGAGGVTGLEESRLSHQVSERDKAYSAASAASARANVAADADRAYQLAVLGRMEGLMPSDLPYIDRQMGAIGLGTGTVTSRVDETPYWQKAVGSVLPAAAGAAVGAFTGRGSTPSRNNIPEYYPGPSADEYRYMYGRP